MGEGVTLNNGADWVHHDYVRIGGHSEYVAGDSAREDRARADLRVLQSIRAKAEILLDMRQQMNPDGDFTMLQDRLTRAQQNVDSMQVIVDAYTKERK